MKKGYNIPLYYTLKVIAAIVILFGWIMIKGIPILFVVYYFLFLDTSGFPTKGWVNIPGSIIFLLSFGISWPVSKFIAGQGFKINDYAKHYKETYISIYGGDYLKPQLKDFNLEEKEYYSFNGRFDFEKIQIILNLAFVLSLWVIIKRYEFPKGFITFLIAVSLIAFGYSAIYYFYKSLDLYFAKKWPQYQKVINYEKALKIYNKIQEEKKEIRLNSEDV